LALCGGDRPKDSLKQIVDFLTHHPGPEVLPGLATISVFRIAKSANWHLPCFT